MIRGTCASCHKTKWFVRKRTFMAVTVSKREPITSEGLLCGKCAKGIKSLISTMK